MAGVRYLFPALYVVFLFPSTPGAPIEAKIVAFFMSSILAFVINMRSIIRIVLLLVTALGTLVPFLFLVQSAICSSVTNLPTGAFLLCVMQRSLAVLLNVGLLSSVFMLAAANEWRGSLVATINGMFLPRSVGIMAIVAGAMIGEFRRAMIRVHHAFTACGKAMPSANWRNLVVLPSMFGAVWASVLVGVVERMKGQWSSDLFWERYLPLERKTDARITFSDLMVLGASGLVIASFFVKFSVIATSFPKFLF